MASGPRPDGGGMGYRCRPAASTVGVMSSRVILVSDDRSSLRSPGTALWPQAAHMRGTHTDGWAAQIFDYTTTVEADMHEVRELASASGADVIHPHGALATQPPGLLVSDVDSTLTRTEAIDLLAQCAGRADEVADVTARAMAGEMDFTESLRARVGCLAGLPVGAVEEARSAIVVTPGAKELIAAAHEAGATVGLVSGGFTSMVEPLAAELGADHAVANELEVADGHLTGRLTGEIVDRAAKASWLRRWAAQATVEAERVIAIGDGANDLDMFDAAGLAIAFCAKPVAVEAARNTVSFERLDAVSAVWCR